MTKPQPRSYRFGEFRIDTGSRELIGADGAAIALTGKAFDVLVYLVERRGQLVAKDELLAQVWAGRVVEDNNLTQAISTLRKALGTGARDHRYILTEARRGYRFVAELRADDASPASQTETRSAPAAAKQRALIIGALLMLVALIVLVAWPQRNPSTSRRDATLALAILPFRPVAGASSDHLLELGLVETLITQLSRSSALRVRSSASSQRVSGDTQDMLEAGRALGAGYVLTGSTQRRGDQMRVNARLLEVATGKTLWADTFDARPGELFALQDRIASAVAAALKIQALPAHAVSACEGANPEAYRAYLTGRHQASRPDAARLSLALAAFQRAIDLDPACAPAYAGMASAFRGLVNIGERDPREMFPLASAAAEQALRIDPSSAEAHFAKASIQFRYDWDWAGAEASYQRALALNPSFSDAHYGYAHLLFTRNRVEQGLRHARLARESDPLSPLTYAIEAHLLAAAGRTHEAQLRLQRALELQPEFWIALLYRGEMALDRGDSGAALADLQRAVTGSRGNTRALAMLGVAHAAAGERPESEKVLRTLRARTSSGYQPATSQAAVHNALGDTERALELLERAYAERDIRLSFLKVESNWDNLRAHPRFRALMRRMNLKQESPTR